MLVNVLLRYLTSYFEGIKIGSPEALISGEKSTRITEIAKILQGVNALEKDNNMPIILAEDFNSDSYLDWIKSTESAHYGKSVE